MPVVDTQGRRDGNESKASPPDGCLDRVLLVGAALLLIVVFGSAFWLVDEYHLNPAWVFLAINSIGMAFLLVKDFRKNAKKRPFLLYLLAWAAVHGILMICLMRYAPLGVWSFVIVAEGTVGILLANYLFGIQPDDSGG